MALHLFWLFDQNIIIITYFQGNNNTNDDDDDDDVDTRCVGIFLFIIISLSLSLGIIRVLWKFEFMLNLWSGRPFLGQDQRQIPAQRYTQQNERRARIRMSLTVPCELLILLNVRFQNRSQIKIAIVEKRTGNSPIRLLISIENEIAIMCDGSY